MPLRVDAGGDQGAPLAPAPRERLLEGAGHRGLRDRRRQVLVGDRDLVLLPEPADLVGAVPASCEPALELFSRDGDARTGRARCR